MFDSDCLWNQPSEELKSIVLSDKVLLYDVMKMNDQPNNLSSDLLGKLYLEIDPKYPTPFPKCYGGELIGGKSNMLRVVSEECERFFNLALDKCSTQSLLSKDGIGVFDGDERISNYVYNKGIVDIYDVEGYIRRIWTATHLHTVRSSDIEIPIWHLPSEKTSGLQQLFNKSVKDESTFWSTPLEQFNRYLGEYVGIPEKKKFTLTQKISRIYPEVRRLRKLQTLSKRILRKC